MVKSALQINVICACAWFWRKTHQPIRSLQIITTNDKFTFKTNTRTGNRL